MAQQPDAIVVGGGIVGAACARELARGGLSVTLIEADFIGGGATAAGMGHIVVMDDSPAQFALTALSRSLLDALAPELTAGVERDRCGTLWVAEDDAQLDSAREKQIAYAAAGIEAALLDADELRRVEPELRPDLAGGMLVPGDGVVYPPVLARWLADDARASGAVVLEHQPVERLDGRSVMTAGGRLDAGIVVNAAGAAAPGLTPGLPIVPRRGHLVITDRHPGFCRHQVLELGYLQSAHSLTGASVAFNVQPRVTGQVLIGSSRELVGWDRSPSRSILTRMLERAAAFMPRLAALSVLRSWIGFRPATADKLPLIGRWPATDGLWIAAGHEGLGITTALGTARLLGDLMLGRPPSLDPVPFDPARVLESAGATGG
jgi:glycine/D-amino acid oxidase-like deaminating enzyme